MWTSRSETLPDVRGRKVVLRHGTELLRYSWVIEAWQTSETFRAFFVSLLADAPYPAYYWETPPLTASNADQTFEFVLIDSPPLATACPDTRAFASYFVSDCADSGVVGFSNLGGDAFLVTPCPVGPPDAYPHLASFSRKAPLPQQHALWRVVGASIAQRIGEEPVWISTAGLGVFWLHVRLDSRPKYYQHAPYRRIPRQAVETPR